MNTEVRNQYAGSKIIIKTRGRIIKGVVLTAFDYSVDDVPNWYIEFRSHSNSDIHNHPDGGYGYWKQGLDGGEVEFVR